MFIYSQAIAYILQAGSTATKQSARVAPKRPEFSSGLGSDEEDEGESFNDHQTLCS